MQWSQQSLDLFDMYRSTDRNVIVQACPGAGKTTNIKHLWSLDGKPTVYLVFNKHNQIEAQQKLSPKAGSAVLTLNGLGHRAITATFGKVQLDDKKVHNIVKQHINFGLCLYQIKRQREWQLINAVRQAKAVLVRLSPRSFDTMLDDYDLESYDGMYKDVQTCLDINDRQTSVIDFADQIRLPALYDLTLPEYDNVLGDEVQDFNALQALLVSKLQADRYVFVGDQHQSIYGFRGAMSNSMQVLADKFKCTELPLSVTYRCASNIVNQASLIFPGAIQAWEQSAEGQVYSSINHDKLSYVGDVLVVCRCNAPLIALAFNLLRQGIACHVRGRDIGAGLIKLIDQLQCTSVRSLIAELQLWYEMEYDKALAKEDETKVQKVQDKYDSLLLFTEKCKLDDSVDCVKQCIVDLFEQGRGICLSTVHKAKGLEAEQCYIVRHKLHDIFAKRARTVEDREQELNCKYVAVTRAKQTLVYM